MNTGMRYTFGKSKIKNTAFEFFTKPDNLDKKIMRIYSISNDIQYDLSYNDIVNNTQNLNFGTQDVVIIGWFDFRQSNDIINFEQTNPISNRELFLEINNNEPFVNTNQTRSGLRNNNSNFDLDSPWICHYIADEEQNDNNERINFGIANLEKNQSFSFQRRGNTRMVYTRSRNFANFTDNYNNCQTPTIGNFNFKIYTFFFNGINLNFYLNNSNIVFDDFSAFSTPFPTKFNILFNTRDDSGPNDLRGKITRVKHFSFKNVSSGYDVQSDINSLLTRYNL